MGNQSITKTRYYRTSTFQIGQFAQAVEELFAKYDQGKSTSINISRNLPDESSIFDQSTSISALEQICIFNDQYINIELSDLSITIMGGSDYFSLEVDAIGSKVLHQIFEHFTKALDLIEVESPSQRAYPPEKTIPGIINRIEKLESAVFDPGNRLKCFLSYRFSAENHAVAQQVKKFLELLDIEVTTGEAYEPRKVSDKILNKIAKGLDLIVLLVTADGESMWTRDEIATANERGAHIVPVVQKEAKFEAGIFGDHEWIPFEEGHISDAFIKILEAVHYIRRKRVEEAISKLE
jgi:hypothetical protein